MKFKPCRLCCVKNMPVILQKKIKERDSSANSSEERI